MKSLLCLPTEILDQIYLYLDWDRSKFLCPTRPDIFSVSLTCRHLRQTIVPFLFKDVILKLRWADDVIAEPALFELRRSHPHLAKYVRSVYIQTHFRPPPDPFRFKDFVVPDQLFDLAQPSVEDRDQDTEAWHRQRVQSLMRALLETYSPSGSLHQLPNLSNYVHEVARKLLDSDDHAIAQTTRNRFLSNADSTGEAQRLHQEASLDRGRGRLGDVDYLDPATVTIQQRKLYRYRRQELDALVLVVLCLPACVNSLAFETVHNRHSEIPQNNFALHVAAMALGIFGDRLKRLTMITSPERGHLPDVPIDQQGENSIITENVLKRITRVGELVLSDHHGDGTPRHRHMSYNSQVRWHVLADAVMHLELWHIQCTSSELVQLVSGFTCLQSLTLQDIMLNASGRPRNQTDHLCWLNCLIELRRQMQDLKLRLGELKSWSDRLRMVTLPRNGLTWLRIEAVPIGYTVGFDRETRLTEDFESFLPLWYAEDSQRGQQARREPRIGKLIDDAMGSRWSTF